MAGARSGNRAGTLPLVILIAACLLASCTHADRAVRLALSLRPGMERLMRIEVREHFEGTSRPGAGGDREREAVPLSFATSLTYRFRVLSVDDAGVAKVGCEVLEASASGRLSRLNELMASLEGQRSLLFLDRAGRIFAAEAGRPPGSGLPGFPLPPGNLSSPGPELGDLQAFLGGLNGRVVSVGETWTSTACPAQAAGLRGTLRWTVEAIGNDEVRLGFRGAVDEQEIALPSLDTGESARMKGDISGFLVLEAATGWPLQGKTVVRVEVNRSGGATHAGSDRPRLSLCAVTLFDPAR